ncbi:hypothetical protein MLD38_003936 [Melastoma candidum]|uniref:Uncharacterized protein n=1 Tax=Melastoma candidum TaxID=119954 RepID=A0ACB9S5G7_9MYRT|nr:hypothetical protein MLD38_003936 [Melastoma candidum]
MGGQKGEQGVSATRATCPSSSSLAASLFPPPPPLPPLGLDVILALLVPRDSAKARTTAITYAEKLFNSHQYFMRFLKSNISVVRFTTHEALRSFINNVPLSVIVTPIKSHGEAICVKL